jgi:hypothetical protein
VRLYSAARTYFIRNSWPKPAKGSQPAAARYHSPPSKKVFSAFLILRATDFFF